MYKAIQPGRLYKSIVEQIEQLILSGELRVNDRLPSERELAVKFGVSRTAVREAIKILSQKGLVSSQTGRGTFVADQTSQAVRNSLELMVKISSGEGLEHVVEVREILEPEIAALAACRAGEAEIKVMRDAVNQMDAILDYRANKERHAAREEGVFSLNAAFEHPDVFIEADLDFHLALAEATHNPLIPGLIDTIVDLLREQRRILSLIDGAVHGQYHHRRILEAVAAHDAAGARERMQAHLHQIREDGLAVSP